MKNNIITPETFSIIEKIVKTDIAPNSDLADIVEFKGFFICYFNKTIGGKPMTTSFTLQKNDIIKMLAKDLKYI